MGQGEARGRVTAGRGMVDVPEAATEVATDQLETGAVARDPARARPALDHSGNGCLGDSPHRRRNPQTTGIFARSAFARTFLTAIRFR